MPYFVIETTEDGVYLTEMSKTEVLEMLERDEEYLSRPALMGRAEHPNLQEGGCRRYIIKGEIVMPREKEVVVEYDID